MLFIQGIKINLFDIDIKEQGHKGVILKLDTKPFLIHMYIYI